MRYKLLAGLLLLLSFAVGCVRDEVPTEREAANAATLMEAHTIPDSHNSQNSLDWTGRYSGVLPCASCPGIETLVTLHEDGTFNRSMLYIDEAPIPQSDSGAVTWNAAGSKVTLGEGESARQYQVGENRLFHLDQNGERITGDLAGRYVLEKHMHDPAIEDLRWRLVELRGSPVESSQTARNPVLTLSSKDSVASGNASCNTFRVRYASGRRRQVRG